MNILGTTQQRPTALLIFCAIAFCHCQNQKTVEEVSSVGYQMVDYVKVGEMMDTVEAPYVIDVQQGKKRVVLVGCVHVYDSTHQQFTVLQNYFKEIRPQIAFNEGGQVSEDTHYSSLSEAASKRGETGSLKYLSDQAGIKMLNGDTEDSVEFAITLKKHPKDKLFLYYAMERIVIPYIYGAYGEGDFEEKYEKFVKSWFVDSGYPLDSTEQDFSYFKSLYLKYTGVDFEPELNEVIEQFDYINGGDCEFCAIGRTSKIVRDSVLLSKISQALEEYDRVMVTFGHGHALAIEPALKQIIQQQ